MSILRLMLVALGCVIAMTQLCFSQTDADLAAFWDFESGRTGTDVWVTHVHGSDTVYGSSNCYDVIGGNNIITSKNDFFVAEFGEPTLSVVSAQSQGIPSFNGSNVLKTTVFNDEQAYLDWGASHHNPDPPPHDFRVKARVDPAVPMGHFKMRDGDEVWIGFALYIPNDYVWETAVNWGTQGIMELQYREDIPSGTSSKGGPFGMSIANGELEIKAVYSPTYHPKDAPNPIKETYTLQKGVWYSIVCHVKYDFTPNGFAKVWINGDEAFYHEDIRLGYAGMQNAAAGLDVMTAYQHNWFLDPSAAAYSDISPAEQFERTLYYDALRVAPVNTGSFALVDPTKDTDPPAGPPDVPVGMSAVAGDDSVALSWTASSGATSYSVKRSVSQGGGYTTLATGVTLTSYADASASNGTTYYYVVSAVSSNGDSDNSAEVSATPTSNSLLSVSAVTASASDSNVPGNTIDNNLSTRWSELSDSSTASEWIRYQLDDDYTVTSVSIAWYKGYERSYEFRVEVSDDGSSWTQILGQSFSGGTTDQFESYDLPDTNASWLRLVCYGNDQNNYNSISEVDIFGYIVVAPLAPAGLSAVGDDGEVSLSWTVSVDADSYVVYRSASSGSGYTQVQSGVTATSYDDSSVANGTTYYYVVTASNVAGESSYSSEASATPQVLAPSVPTGLVAVADDAEVSLSWSSVSGADTYKVYRLSDVSVGYVLVASGLTTISFADSGLINGASYSYQVTAVNAGGESAASASAQATPQLVLALGVTAATATDSDSNVPGNAIDGNLATRWSALCDSPSASETITFELEAAYVVTSIDVAWYKGYERSYEFRVEVSSNGSTWTEVLGQTFSSGATDQFETYDLADAEASWVRLVGYGNEDNNYNSISEVVIDGHAFADFFDPAISSVSSSGDDGTNVDDNTIDGNLGTRWSSDGLGEWISYELADELIVSAVEIAWHQGNLRESYFTVEGSLDGSSWFEIAPLTTSSGSTLALELYDLKDARCSWIRITGYGNEDNDYISLNEVVILGYEAVDPVVEAVDASGHQTGHPPADTIDSNLVSRWSQEGVGEWIRYEFTESFTIASLSISWFNGDARQADFAVEASSDGSTWTPILGLTASSGTTTALELYDVLDTETTWVRIVGFGNSDSDWNSINEVEFYGY